MGLLGPRSKGFSGRDGVDSRDLLVEREDDAAERLNVVRQRRGCFGGCPGGSGGGNERLSPK